MISSDILEKSMNKEISYEAFFHAFGYKDNNVVYFRSFIDNAESPAFLALPSQDQERASHGINSQVELWNINAILPTLHERNAAALGVYFIVNGGGNNDAEVKGSKIARAQFMEIDGLPFPEQLERIRGFPLEPSIIIKTKKSLHTYWLLNEGNIKHFREIQQRLVQHFGADTSNVNESRVMRLYGFNHMKAEPCQVTLIKFDPELRYTQKQLAEVLPEYDKQFWDNTKRLPHISGLQSAEGGAITYGNRHVSMCSVGLSLLMRYGDTEKAQERFLQHSMRCEPLLPERDLSRIWNNTRSKYYRDVASSPDYKPPEEYEKSLQQFPPRRDGAGSQGTATEAAKADPPPLTCMADVEETEVQWLFPEIMPIGAITTLAADGGSGKTFQECQLLASVSTGNYSSLFGTPNDGNPANALVFNGEDGLSDILKKRLRLSGSDDRKIFTASMTSDIWNDINFQSRTLDYYIRYYKPKLVVFDPIQQFLPENVQMERRNHMRRILSNLTSIAQKYQCSILLVAHTNKQRGNTGRTRIADSADLWDISRSVLMSGTRNNDGSGGNAGFYLSHEKSNYGKCRDTYLYSINDEGLHFEGTTQEKDRDFVYQKLMLGDGRKQKEAPKRDNTAALIDEYLELQEGGVCEIGELDDYLKSLSITSKTIRSAKEIMKAAKAIRIFSEGFGKQKKWFIERLTPFDEENHLFVELDELEE